MTTRTVEVERTVTDEEEVTICDDCGREVDEPWTFYPKTKKDELPDLHFHRGCFKNVTLDDYVSSELTDKGGHSVRLVMTTFEIGTFTVSIAALAGAVLVPIPLFKIIAAAIGILGLVATIGVSVSQARRPEDWFDV